MLENRRQFIKKTCGLCASIVGISMLVPALQGCSALQYVKPEIVQGKISFPISSFIEGSNLLIIQNNSLDYDIAVVRGENNSFRSFELKCTHQDNSLIATASGFHCNLHGSSFNLEGKVNNPPATSNLREYKTAVDSGIIQVIL